MKFSKIAGPEINTPKLWHQFLHADNKQLEIEIEIGALIPFYKLAGRSNRKKPYLSRSFRLYGCWCPFLQGRRGQKRPTLNAHLLPPATTTERGPF